MRENRVKKVIREGGLAVGTYVSLADPQVVEIIGLAGFDAAFIDMEHTGFDLPLIGEMTRAADVAGVTSMVRVPDNDAKLILRLLDMGAEGIIVPHVDGVEGAKRAVEAVRYPPLGDRGGAGGTRAARFGTVSWTEHVRQSNDQIVLSVMAEDDKALAEVEEIAEIAEIVKRVGRARLSIPMNHAALPLGPKDLLDLGVGYTHVGPPPPAILLRSMQGSVRRVNEATGR